VAKFLTLGLECHEFNYNKNQKKIGDCIALKIKITTASISSHLVLKTCALTDAKIIAFSPVLERK